MQTTTHIKVCCIQSIGEARLASQAGVSAVGLVSAMPSGPGVIDETTIATIAPRVPPGVSTFLLTSLRDAGEIAAQVQRCGVHTVQLCDALRQGTYDDLRRAVPGIRIVQVIHVTGPDVLPAAEKAARVVDALLLDSGRPDDALKELGGTGRTHDWSVSATIRARVDVPIFLAGGLSPENVAQAIKSVAPFAVDVCSGVRTNGRLDPAKLGRFVAAVRAASTVSPPPVGRRFPSH